MNRYYNDKLAKITHGDPEKDYHVQGEVTACKGYTFEGKIYDVGSQYGIDAGRISKLMLRRDGQLVANYDRGVIEPPKRPDDVRAWTEVTVAFSEPVRSQTTEAPRAAEDWDQLAAPSSATPRTIKPLPERNRDRDRDR